MDMPFGIADIIVILLFTIGPPLMATPGTDLGLIAKTSTEAH
jgi:hypothetical protein